MQLISLPVSPFAARIRIAIYAKGLDIEVMPPPSAWRHAPEFRHLSPTGRLPVLILDNGQTIWESTVILEFLEERFPQARPLLPIDAQARAMARLLVLHADLYMMPPMISLAQSQQDESATRSLVEQLVESFAILDPLIPGAAYAIGGRLSLADCALVPTLFAAEITGERIDVHLVDAAPRVRAYAKFVRQDEHIARVIAQMEEGLQLLTASG